MKKIVIIMFFCIVPVTCKSMIVAAQIFGKMMVGSARPFFQKAQGIIKPSFEKMMTVTQENPKQAAYVLGGAVAGYGTSGDGIIDTIGGTVLGGYAGAYFAGAHVVHTVRIAYLEKLVGAVALENAMLRKALIDFQMPAIERLALGKKAEVAFEKFSNQAVRTITGNIKKAKEIFFQASNRVQMYGLVGILSA